VEVKKNNRKRVMLTPVPVGLLVEHQHGVFHLKQRQGGSQERKT
jgi:hypothetical protein